MGIPKRIYFGNVQGYLDLCSVIGLPPWMNFGIYDNRGLTEDNRSVTSEQRKSEARGRRKKITSKISDDIFLAFCFYTQKIL